MDEIKLRFPGADIDDFPLATGVHGVGRDARSGAIAPVADGQATLVQFCVDRRGVWMTVTAAVNGVHVNGRPVQRMAMLRVGDAIYVDGVEMILMAGTPVPPIPAKLARADADGEGDPRVVLRGVGGRHHGRSFTLERPRLVGRAAEADICIDDPAFADRHARIDLHGDTIVLRDLGSVDGSVVNGEPVRDAVLKPGDQIVFDAHHRFVVEAPARAVGHGEPASAYRDETPMEMLLPAGGGAATRRLPWLLLAALLIAGALSALLLFGTSS